MAMQKQQTKVYITKELILQLAIIAICVILPLFLISDLQVLPFVIIAAIIGGILVLKQPFLGLLFYLFVFYIRPQEIWFTGVVALEKTLGIAMLALTIVKLKLKDNFRFKITNVHIAIAVFLIISLMNVATSLWIEHSWEIWIKQFRLFIVFFCIVHLIDTEKQFKFFIVYTILGTLFHASSAVIRYYQGIREVEMGIERAFAMDTSLGDPNSLAATIVYTLPLIFYYITKDTSRKMKVFLMGTVLVMLWCVILTGSRTGMAGVLMFGLLMLWERKNKIRNFIIIGVALVTIVAVMPEQYLMRFESITNIDAEHDNTGAAISARSRITFLKLAFQMFLDRPILGYGMGNFSTAMGTIYGNTWLQAHTLPAQIMSEMGLLGIISFTAWIVIMFKYLKRLRRYFAATNKKFFFNMTLAMKNHLFLLFFMGLGGHNLFRYNWFIIASIVVLLLNSRVTGYGLPVAGQTDTIDTDQQKEIAGLTGQS